MHKQRDIQKQIDAQIERHAKTDRSTNRVIYKTDRRTNIESYKNRQMHKQRDMQKQIDAQTERNTKQIQCDAIRWEHLEN